MISAPNIRGEGCAEAWTFLLVLKIAEKIQSTLAD